MIRTYVGLEGSPSKSHRILDQNRVMAIATIRSDGWPQNTMVSFANEDILIYSIISRKNSR